MSLTYQPFAATPEIENLGSDLRMNVPDSERVASAVAGFTFIGSALRRKGASKWLFLLGGIAFLRRGWTGECPCYRHFAVDHRHGDVSGVPGNRGIKVESTVYVNRSPAVLYKFWQGLEHLPRVMRHVISVLRQSGARSHWKVKGPLGQPLEWEAEIINQEENRFIAWQTLPGATVRNAGSIWFEPTDTGSTRVKVAFEYDPPGGALGGMISRLLGASPQKDLEEDLADFSEFAGRELPVFG